MKPKYAKMPPPPKTEEGRLRQQGGVTYTKTNMYNIASL